MRISSLSFEQSLTELDRQIEELSELTRNNIRDCSQEIDKLNRKRKKQLKEIFDNLTPWQRAMLARHPDRPYTRNYLKWWGNDYMELRGDRIYADDNAIVGCIATVGEETMVVIGHQKGRDTQENLKTNFGMPNPEGYRKALRLMKLAEKFRLPVLTLIDTPGAYPGIGAEERGQSVAIANNLKEMFSIEVPIISVITGEGGSGGALALGVGDRILMFENSVYSVISPESCATILWHDSSKAEDAAEPLKLTAADGLEFKIIDEVLEEPEGGAHCDHQKTAEILKEAVLRNLHELKEIKVEELLTLRYNKFRGLGAYTEL
ncbi:MAG: acetyl-CoA carboxylase carboxyltransferase subunit alpha [bacterium]